MPASFQLANLTEYEPTRTFDRVSTSYGMVGLLPGLNRWAALVNKTLKPGKRLLLVGFHPVVMEK